MFKERRSYPRFDIPLCVEFKQSGKKDKYSVGLTDNFSRKGLCFKSTTFDLEPFEMLKFKMQLPGGDTFVPVSGDVIWKKKVDDHLMVGIKFREIHTEAKCEILECCYSTWLDRMQAKNRNRKMTCEQNTIP